jgi:hypothetical protein
MGVLIIFAVLGLLGWIVLSTISSFRREKVSSTWWIFFYSLLLVGIIAGVWAGFRFEYQVSPTLRFAGFPFPMAIFQLESGIWVDYVHETFIMILIGIADIIAVAFIFIFPLSATFYIRCVLQKRRLAITHSNA